MTMKFLKQNFLNTTTMVTVNDGTDTVENLFDRNTRTAYVRNINTGTAQHDITVTFSSPVVISKVFIQNHNLKNYHFFLSGNPFNIPTPPAESTNNSDSSNIHEFASVTVSSISLRMLSTTSGDNSITIGQIYTGDTILNFERNPSAIDYKPIKNRKQVVHKMPDGGVTQFIIRDKFKAQIKWKYLSASFTSQLENVYDTGTAFYFVPFATTTAWDGKASEVVWTNNFDFRHSSNNKDAGFGGKIIIEDTA